MDIRISWLARRYLRRHRNTVYIWSDEDGMGKAPIERPPDRDFYRERGTAPLILMLEQDFARPARTSRGS